MKSNPFSSQYTGHDEDAQLAAGTLAGDATALDALVRRHQPWLYNLALRMVWEPADAEDLTQECLLRIIAKLGTFRGESSFRTWAYRVATNHILNYRRTRVEHVITGFDCYGKCLAEMADSDTPESLLLVDEARVGCMIGMLLCLDRDQRLVYVLAEIFDAPDTLAGELLDISPDNFRQRLSRARQQLHSFMRGHCGLADPANPCRCARKTRGFIKAGIVDPDRLRFDRRYRESIAESARQRSQDIGALSSELGEMRALLDPPDFAVRLRELLGDRRLRGALNLS